MTRRCAKCHESTPASDVNSCPHCGIKFRPRSHRPASTSFVATRLPRENSGGPYKGSSSCQYKRLCAEFLSSLKWEEHFFNRRQNRCYCNRCYPDSSCDIYETGGSTYVVPRGWCRFGLQVDQVRAQIDKIWHDWIITYHETSPTIPYSSNPIYCATQKFRSPYTNKQYNAHVVLQCRQKPGTFKVQGETIGAGHQRICPIISNDRIEILTTTRAAIVPYGLLIQLTEVSTNGY